MGPDGYAWWYLDGISHDGSRAVSVIGFIGSVFSPWYAWSGRREPQNHCCLNVATYGPGGRFCMTDRGRDALRQSADRLTIGPSSLHWTGRELVVTVNEWAAPPIPGAVRGTITVTPAAVTEVELALTPDGAHVWRPFAPTATIRVDLNGPGWQWEGDGYLDANFGTRALEADFDTWTWARFPHGDGAVCFYDVARRDGSTLEAAIAIDPDGAARLIDGPPQTSFATPFWRVARATRADPGTTPREVMGMLDAPFYNRSMVETRIEGQAVRGVHEALDLRRFRNPLVKAMLACRVPRRAGWSFDPQD